MCQDWQFWRWVSIAAYPACHDQPPDQFSSFLKADLPACPLRRQWPHRRVQEELLPDIAETTVCHLDRMQAAISGCRVSSAPSKHQCISSWLSLLLIKGLTRCTADCHLWQLPAAAAPKLVRY